MSEVWEEFRDFDERDPAPVECKYCGESPLWWFESVVGWKLIDGDGSDHVCSKERFNERQAEEAALRRMLRNA